MPQPMLILLDHMEKAITDLDHGIARRSLTKTRIAFETLTALSNYLKELLPEEFIEENFEAFDRHMSYIETFLKKKDFDYIKSNFDDIREEDFPDLKKVIYDLPKGEKTSERIMSNKVFIVHGRNHKPMKELKTMLEEFALDPVVLHEKPSASKTIVEKLEKYSDVGYAFVVLTPDDGLFNLQTVVEIADKTEAISTSQKKKDELFFDSFLKNISKVARQNVILEFGYFMGLLGRDRVCCLYQGNVELPSDMHGIVYIPFKESVNEVEKKIAKELKEAGYKIKL